MRPTTRRRSLLRPAEALGHDAAEGLRELGRRPFREAQLSVAAALLLHLALPERLSVGPRWLVPALEGALLVGLAIKTPKRLEDETLRRRGVELALIALVSAANLAALALLVHYLLRGGAANGHQLILAAVDIWLTNVVAFGLWFWQLDRGGPDRGEGERERDMAQRPREQRQPHFAFIQMTDPDATGGRGWQPGFVDYLYVSLTNSTAFSPTDTLPLTAVAKSLMGLQALTSLITVALVAARAVNILAS